MGKKGTKKKTKWLTLSMESAATNSSNNIINNNNSTTIGNTSIKADLLKQDGTSYSGKMNQTTTNIPNDDDTSPLELKPNSTNHNNNDYYYRNTNNYLNNKFHHNHHHNSSSNVHQQPPIIQHHRRRPFSSSSQNNTTNTHHNYHHQNHHSNYHYSNGKYSNYQNSGPLGGTRINRTSESKSMVNYSSNEQNSNKENNNTDTAKLTFNEDEYTRITTPRQDVLFKKGYLSRPKRISTAPMMPLTNDTTNTPSSSGAVSVTSTEDSTTPISTQSVTPEHCHSLSETSDPDYAFMYPGFFDQNGVFYVNHFIPNAFDSYGGQMMMMPYPGAANCFPVDYYNMPVAPYDAEQNCSSNDSQMNSSEVITPQTETNPSETDESDCKEPISQTDSACSKVDSAKNAENDEHVKSDAIELQEENSQQEQQQQETNNNNNLPENPANFYQPCPQPFYPSYYYPYMIGPPPQMIPINGFNCHDPINGYGVPLDETVLERQLKFKKKKRRTYQSVNSTGATTTDYSEDESVDERQLVPTTVTVAPTLISNIATPYLSPDVSINSNALPYLNGQSAAQNIIVIPPLMTTDLATDVVEVAQKSNLNVEVKEFLPRSYQTTPDMPIIDECHAVDDAKKNVFEEQIENAMDKREQQQLSEKKHQQKNTNNSKNNILDKNACNKDKCRSDKSADRNDKNLLTNKKNADVIKGLVSNNSSNSSNNCSSVNNKDSKGVAKKVSNPTYAQMLGQNKKLIIESIKSIEKQNIDLIKTSVPIATNKIETKSIKWQTVKPKGKKGKQIQIEDDFLVDDNDNDEQNLKDDGDKVNEESLRNIDNNDTNNQSSLNISNTTIASSSGNSNNNELLKHGKAQKKSKSKNKKNNKNNKKCTGKQLAGFQVIEPDFGRINIKKTEISEEKISDEIVLNNDIDYDDTDEDVENENENEEDVMIDDNISNAFDNHEVDPQSKKDVNPEICPEPQSKDSVGIDEDNIIDVCNDKEVEQLEAELKYIEEIVNFDNVTDENIDKVMEIAECEVQNDLMTNGLNDHSVKNIEKIENGIDNVKLMNINGLIKNLKADNRMNCIEIMEIKQNGICNNGNYHTNGNADHSEFDMCDKRIISNNTATNLKINHNDENYDHVDGQLDHELHAEEVDEKEIEINESLSELSSDDNEAIIEGNAQVLNEITEVINKTDLKIEQNGVIKMEIPSPDYGKSNGSISMTTDPTIKMDNHFPITEAVLKWLETKQNEKLTEPLLRLPTDPILSKHINNELTKCTLTFDDFDEFSTDSEMNDDDNDDNGHGNAENGGAINEMTIKKPPKNLKSNPLHASSHNKYHEDNAADNNESIIDSDHEDFFNRHSVTRTTSITTDDSDYMSDGQVKQHQQHDFLPDTIINDNTCERVAETNSDFFLINYHNENLKTSNKNENEFLLSNNHKKINHNSIRNSNNKILSNSQLLLNHKMKNLNNVDNNKIIDNSVKSQNNEFRCILM